MSVLMLGAFAELFERLGRAEFGRRFRLRGREILLQVIGAWLGRALRPPV